MREFIYNNKRCPLWITTHLVKYSFLNHYISTLQKPVSHSIAHICHSDFECGFLSFLLKLKSHWCPWPFLCYWCFYSAFPSLQKLCNMRLLRLLLLYAGNLTPTAAKLTHISDILCILHQILRDESQPLMGKVLSLPFFSLLETRQCVCQNEKLF